MSVRLLDTLTGALQELPPAPYEVKLYVCGITPYSSSHIGHAVPIIVFDALVRYLRYRGYTVRHVTNFTDIDDKLIAAAESQNTTVKALADKFSDQYLGSLKRLNARPADVYPRATEEISRIVEITQGLIERGYAYESEGDVYYRVRKKDDYGKLSHRKIDDLKSGARIDPTERKEDPLDFALWKGAKPGEPSWDSPFGPGRPGWHIECSAMSYGHLGEQIDIHGGGADLIFPHHENEIAQTEGFTGKAPFAKVWMHNALLQMGSDKMSKSTGNVVDLDAVIDRWGADAIRLFILSSHYRSPLTYSEEALQAAGRGAERMRAAAFATPTGTIPGPDVSGLREEFEGHMDGDLGTAEAIAVLFDLVRLINRERDAGHDTREMQALLRELAGVLGFGLEAAHGGSRDADPFIELLIQVRTEMRAAKQWAFSDQIRDGLRELGVELKDSAEGTVWIVSP